VSANNEILLTYTGISDLGDSGDQRRRSDLMQLLTMQRGIRAYEIERGRNAGVVHSKKGPGGGYMLTCPPGDIKLGYVIRRLDGPLAPIACASRTAYQPCDDCEDNACAVRLTMVKVRDAMSDILDRLMLADMLALDGGSGAAVMYHI
jgi:hypothetical protein